MKFEQMHKLIDDSEKKLISRIAWLYFVKGHTQQQIADSLGLSRMKVQRGIVKSKKIGLVEIHIRDPLTTCFEKEADLIDRFALLDARVIPTPQDSQLCKEAVGKTAANYLLQKVHDNQVIGAGWGTTLRETTRFIALKKPVKGVRVVSLTGGWTRPQSDSPYELTTKLAEALNAECFNIAAPVVADSVKSQKIITDEKSIKQILQMAKQADLAIIGIGNAAISASASLTQAGYVTPDEVRRLRDRGAVGDILGYFYDRKGRPMHDSFNERVIGIGLEGLKQLKVVIGVAGGREKAQAIFGALRGKYLNILITDEETAQAILNLNSNFATKSRSHEGKK